MNAVRRITLLTNPDICNLRCPLCFLNQRGQSYFEISGIAGEMDFCVAKAAIERYALRRDRNGKCLLREVIPSTMGEPLLYSRFDDLLALCRSLGIPLNLTTNGTFPGSWGDEVGMYKLLQACSDIKISSLASESFGGWKKNVERLLKVRSDRRQETSVSIQATLHRKNLMMVPELIVWATAIGINRIKWNSVVFLSDAPKDLRNEYGLDRSAEDLRNYILDCSKMCGSPIRHEGSLFVTSPYTNESECPFVEELWILPDGSEQHCPNPERRFGRADSPEAKCCFI